MGRKKIDDKIKFIQLGVRKSVIKTLTEERIKTEAKKKINELYENEKKNKTTELQ